jgi:hypothetical protein
MTITGEKQSLYVKSFGGFSGGGVNTSGRLFEVSLKRKQRNNSFIGMTWLSSMYLAVKDIVNGLFPYLQLILLIKVLKPF